MQPESLSESTSIRAADQHPGAASAPEPAARESIAVPTAPSTGRVVLTLGDAPPTAPDDRTVITNRPPQSDAPPPILSTPQSIGETLIGKQLDHYELVEFVGGGGMGAVFRANDMRLGRTVAVKVLSRDQSDEETIRRFRNEAQSAARLDHPNIARVFFVGESAGWNYIVFEFIEGTNLRDLVDDLGPLPLEDALSYTLQIAEALAHSSSRDVVHRDIKPSNVLVTAEGQAKLVDMGLARLHQVESSSDDLTASGVTLGTFDYISPEQARDPRVADARSDIYSLGCTLFYLLAGQPPFPEGTALQKLLRHNDEERPDVRQFRPDVPSSVAALVAKMLAKRPSQRHQSPGDLIAHLVSLGRELGFSSLAHRRQATLPTPVVNRWSAAAWQIVGAAALLAAAIVVLDSLLSAGMQPLELRRQPKLAAAAPEAGRENMAPGESLTPSESPRLTPGPGAGSPGTTVAASSNPRTGTQNPVATPPVSEVPAVASQPTDTGPDLSGGEASVGAEDVSSPTELALLPPPITAILGEVPHAAILGSENDSGGSLTIGPLPRKISRLIVAAQRPTMAPPDVEYVGSLATACQRASELNLSEIELHFSGRQIEPPLELSVPKLTLRAGPGFRPVIVFQPQLTTLDPVREMIRLTGGSTSRLAIHGVELRMELPAVPSYGWSLVAIQTGQTLELSDCVLTVVNEDERHSQVAMIDVRARRPSDTMTMAVTMADTQPSMASPTRLSLDRCIARGAASVIGMNEETPLSVRWNQGLIVTPWSLVATGGSVTNPTRFEPVSLALSHVTAICQRGLYLMQRRPGSSYQLSVDTVADNCILMTDADAPLFEFLGVADVAEGDLQFGGQNNVYPNANALFLRYRSQAGGVATQFPVSERNLKWSEEKSPQTGDPWRPPLDLSLPAHSRTKDEFNMSGAMTIDAGFDSSALPETTTDAVPTPAESSDSSDESAPAAPATTAPSE